VDRFLFFPSRCNPRDLKHIEEKVSPLIGIIEKLLIRCYQSSGFKTRGGKIHYYTSLSTEEIGTEQGKERR